MPQARKRSLLMGFMVGWTIICVVMSLMFLTVITLKGAPLDEWVFFALMALAPWILLAVAKAVK